MRISLNIAAVRQLSFGDLAKRFVLGGAVTAVAGVIASLWGPSLGGLFLAFPAILPMALTLIADDQQARKERLGLHGVVSGRKAAALDAFGAFMGTGGLCAFALVVHRLAGDGYRATAVAVATLVWCAISSGLWWLRRHAPRSTRVNISRRCS